MCSTVEAKFNTEMQIEMRDGTLKNFPGFEEITLFVSRTGRDKTFLAEFAMIVSNSVYHAWNLSPPRDTVVTECLWIDKEQYAFAFAAAAETAIALADAESEIEHCLCLLSIQSIRAAQCGDAAKTVFPSTESQINTREVA